MVIEEYVPLADHTTFRLGGPARYFCTVETLDDLRQAVSFAREHTLPIFMLGGGSNVLFGDAGWSGVVIRLHLGVVEYGEGTRGDVRVVAGAGVVWDTLVDDTVSQGMWGMENLSFIPGTVGATPVQNVGAYGVEVKEIIDWVEVFDIVSGELHVFSQNECAFSYRTSVFRRPEGKDFIVTKVAYRLSASPHPRITYRDLAEHFDGHEPREPREVRDALRSIRMSKLPNLTEVGTAGSFFKNPIVTHAQYRSMSSWLGTEPPCHTVDADHVKVPLAWILDTLGWKGKREGHVGTWANQPLVLVHYGNGTARELMKFAQDIAHDVKARTGITIEPEVCLARVPV